MSLVKKTSEADRQRSEKEIAHAEDEHGCDCKPFADVQENGVVLAHGPDCQAFGREAFRKLTGQ